MTDQGGEMSPRQVAAGIVGFGVLLAFVTFVAGELDRLYGGDRSFWRMELVLIAYAGLWTPCVMLVWTWRGSRIFGSAERYYEFNRRLKTGGPVSGIELGVLRRTIRLRQTMNFVDLWHGLLNTVVVAALVLGSTFHHWITATWFVLGALGAFTSVLRTSQLTNRLVTELDARSPARGRRDSK